MKQALQTYKHCVFHKKNVLIKVKNILPLLVMLQRFRAMYLIFQLIVLANMVVKSLILVQLIKIVIWVRVINVGNGMTIKMLI